MDINQTVTFDQLQYISFPVLASKLRGAGCEIEEIMHYCKIDGDRAHYLLLGGVATITWQIGLGLVALANIHQVPLIEVVPNG